MFQARSRTSSGEGSPPSPSPMAATAAASGAALNTSSDSNIDDDPNSSIINKVRSRVSSIFPGALSKWFSPAKRPRENDSASSTPAGRNGNLLRGRRRESSSSDADEDHLVDDEQQQQQQLRDEDEEEADDAPPTRKKKRTEEGFNTSLEFNADMSVLPGPSGLNLSAIDRRSSLPAGAQLARSGIRSTFSSSTPSTSPQSSGDPGGTAIRQQKTNMTGYINRTAAPFNFGAAVGSSSSTAGNRDEQDRSQQDSLSTSIRHRRGIREVSNRKRLNIPPMAVDRSTSEPPAPIFGGRSIFERANQLLQPPQMSNEDLIVEEGPEHVAEDKTLSNGNLNESASESSSVSNLNLSQSEQIESRRMSGFMGNNRSKRVKVGGSTGDLCFSSHLETEKSLFSAKNAGRIGRPTFNSSLYGSSFSLGSSNSSLFANSPFYNGRTMYGGASAYSARRDVRQKALRVPVQIRPSSSLSNFSSSNASLASDTSALSSTAKRILEIMNQCSGPLNEARKLGSSLSLNSTLATAKVPGLVQARKRFNEEDLTINRSIRMSSPRTPYSRPQSATGNTSSSINKPPTAELQIPSMSQLLHMKRLQSNTESVRRLATESTGSTALNEPSEYKLPTESDDSNNNVKHTSKMRNKLHRIREECHSDRSNNTPVPQVNLPEIKLAGLKSVPKFDIKLPTAASSNNSKTDKGSSVNRSSNVTKDPTTAVGNDKNSFVATSTSLPTTTNNNIYKLSSPVKLDLPAKYASVSASKAQNNFKFSNPEPANGSSVATSTAPLPKLGGFKFNPDTAKPKTNPTPSVALAPSATIVPLKSGSCLDALKSPPVPELKTGSCLDALAKPVTGVSGVSSTDGFGSAFKLTGSDKWECDTCMIRNNADKVKCVACETPKSGAKSSTAEAPKANFSFGVSPLTASKSAPASDAGFKALVAQQSSKWECSDCMTRNDSDKMKCACCDKAKPGASTAVLNSSSATAVPAAVKAMFSMPATTPVSSSDQGFKALVAQQSAKWECSACMTRNDSNLSKCACCEQAKPGSTPTDAPSFSFGSKPSTTSTGNIFSSGVTKSGGFSFGVPANTTSAPTTTSTTTGFTFGTVPTTENKSKPDDKPKFTFGGSGSSSSTSSSVTPAGGFSFGIKPTTVSDTTDSSKTSSEKKEESKPTVSFGSGGFSFGAPKATSTEETKRSETVTSTTTSSSGFSFGSSAALSAPKTTESPKTTATTGFLFAKPAEQSDVSTTTPAAITSSAEEPKPIPVIGVYGSTATKTTTPAASLFTFGSGSAPVVSDASKPAPAMFSFGSPKPAASTVATSKPETSTASTTAASSVPIFGGAQKSTGPSITPSFSFVATAPGSTTASSSAASSTTTVTVAPTFSFGTAAKPVESNASNSSTSTTTGTSPARSFVFGQSTQQPANKVVPTFGATSALPASSAAEQPVFGTFGAAASSSVAQATAPAGSIFGSATTNTGSATGFSFGATTATSATAKPAEPATSAFTFGANKSTTATSTPPTFGSPASSAKSIFDNTSASVPTFGGFGAPSNTTSGNPPAFGSSASGGAFSGSGAGSGSLFGQTSVPAFGSPNASASTNPPPAFGAAPTTFGGMNSGANPFGAAPSADEPQAKKSFEFGSNSNVNSQPASLFQFGTGSNNNNNDNGAKPFSFSAHSTPNFNFTAGSNAGQTAAPVAAPAFQFGAATAMPQQNPFAATSIPGTSMQQQLRRKIRTARRATPR